VSIRFRTARQSGPPKDYRKWKSGKTRWLFLVALLSSLENKKGTLDRDYQRGVFDGRFLDSEGYRRRRKEGGIREASRI
jgi:hypothetical protein